MFCDELFEPFGNDFEEPLVRNNAGTKGFIFLVTSLIANPTSQFEPKKWKKNTWQIAYSLFIFLKQI